MTVDVLAFRFNFLVCSFSVVFCWTWRLLLLFIQHRTALRALKCLRLQVKSHSYMSIKKVFSERERDCVVVKFMIFRINMWKFDWSRFLLNHMICNIQRKVFRSSAVLNPVPFQQLTGCLVRLFEVEFSVGGETILILSSLGGGVGYIWCTKW